MYRIWIGLNPRMVLFAVHTAISIMVLVIHLFAFSVVNYPTQGNERYQSAAATR